MKFGLLNYTILAFYLIGMLAIGLHFARKQESGETFFLGNRKLPWWAVGMSMYASLTSAVTYLAVPGTAYQENIALIMVSIMSPLVAPVILKIFYPVYHRLGVTTSYQYILERFGPAARYGVAALFILARLGWLGTVVYAPALAMSVATAIPLWVCICLMGLLSTLYTAMGGLTAVVWTDVIQFIILIGGAFWIAVSLTAQTEGGTAHILQLARDTGRLHIADWKFGLYNMSGPIVAISFFFQLMQDYGTDQITVQRLMATGSLKNTIKSVSFNALTDLFVIALLLFIGLGLFAFFQQHPLPDTISGDRIMPYYIISQLPSGISGLLITAIFAAAMSSIDSGINSIATVAITDFINPIRKKRLQNPARSEVKLARLLTLLLGLFATATAFYISTIGGIIKAFASFMGLFSAPVLALFLLGITTKRGSFAGWCVGLAASFGTSYLLQHVIEAHWVYYFPAAFITAYLGALLTLPIRALHPKK
jgi:solute:Na+ symporter, SSS family